MEWSLERTVAPVAPVVSLAEAKLHLRVEHDAEDALIERIVRAATERAEEVQARAYVTQTFRLVLPRFPSGRVLRLPRPPLQQVTSITYMSTAGAIQTVAPSEYRVDTAAVPGRVILNQDARWPAPASEPDAVAVTYVAGYGDAGEDVPEEQRAAVLLFVGHLYESREAITVGTGPTFKLAYGPEYLLWPDRVFEFNPLGDG